MRGNVQLMSVRTPRNPSSQRKLKPREDTDVAIRRVSARTADVTEIADPSALHVVAVGERELRPGQVWEVRHSGRYRSGRLRFAALARRRTDMLALPAR